MWKQKISPDSWCDLWSLEPKISLLRQMLTSVHWILAFPHACDKHLKSKQLCSTGGPGGELDYTLAREVSRVEFEPRRVDMHFVCMDEWMNGWMNGRTDGWKDEWMDGWMDEWMNEWMNEWMDGWMDEWVDEWMNGWMNEWMNERMYEWMSGWKDRWMDE